MASSDDEGEVVPGNVSDYGFVNGEDEPISFAELPVHWNKGEILDGKQRQIFLLGTTDSGLRRIFKQVKAWKFDLSDEYPVILVLSKENNWIKLLKPRKAFEDTIRTILITVQYLHFVKWNPETSRETIWDHLSDVFRSFKSKPSENDLENHISLINEAMIMDETLTKAEDIVTDDDTTSKKEDNTSDEEEDCFDSVCAICDNGGSLFCCEGKCKRSFHLTAESHCKSLGYTDAEMKKMKTIDFYCKNCEYKQHQCFVCGELGSSDESSGAEVFHCVNGACGHFYHPLCVVKLLHPGDKTEAEKHKKKIVAGEPFACPLHKCCVCEELEVKSEPDLQFAICRRCPKAYHRKCLPTEIAFEKDEDKGIPQRAWDCLIPNRILIYCLDHDIVKRIKTPVRNHIKFPCVEDNKKRKPLGSSGKKKVVLEEGGAALDKISAKKSDTKPSKGVEDLSFGVKQGDLSKKRGGEFSGLGSSKKHKVMDVHETHMNKISLGKSNETATSEPKLSLGKKSHSVYGKDSRPVKSSRVERTDGKPKQTQMVKLDTDTKTRILAMTKDVSSSVTLEKILKKHKAPSTDTQSSKHAVDKNVTLGKVEGSVEVVCAALQKLEETSSVQDAKAVCDTDLLDQVMKWKNKLKVHLSPFLCGTRYTSFGRHFTKKDKLKEIVDMLHWYVQGGDTIVDFCCGSNDFSCLMKKKLDEMGKSCSYKNYDIVQAENNFNFERRDWMGVRAKELPKGSQLIMGLNPPFGVDASLANIFINKALEFKPKLLILIAPRETQRLGDKEFLYDLVWENDQMLASGSFYLPGSVDENDKHMEDWNVNPPPLCLWSRPDWAAKHKAIAQQHGHSSRAQEKLQPEESQCEMHLFDFPKAHHNLGKSSTGKDDDSHVDNKQEVRLDASCKKGLPHDCSGTEGDRNDGCGKNHSITNSKRIGKRKWERGPNEKFPEDKSTGKRSVSSHPSPNMVGSRSLDRPCINEVDYSYAWDVDMRSRAHLHGTQAPDSSSQITDFLANAGPGFPSSWGEEVPPANSSYGGMHTSVIQRYTPRPDELNHTMLNGMASGPPFADTSGFYPPPVSRPGFRANSFYFAPGPYHPYSQNNSAGWLNE
ncbi:Protein ENHANCED DOWNY MILDEW 2 [Abeliophyllum distichum]|uniref:Protein ENHANCED DOWNY MILDEW 2 n=1 Tax=Abeliophyllum distichum TaxID=126358 RepID=A0ABD1UG75_9LAMI